MSRFIAISLLALVLVAAAGCASRPVTTAEPARVIPPSMPSNVPGEVAAEFKRSTAAWNNGDLETFLSLYADDASLAQREGFLVGKSAIRMLYSERLANGPPRDTLEIERLDVAELSQDFALVRGVYHTTRNGKVTWRGAMTVIMRRINGQWRIIHDHSN